MKKVNSIGKKLMAVGLSASLLMGSVGANSGFAMWPTDSQDGQTGFYGAYQNYDNNEVYYPEVDPIICESNPYTNIPDIGSAPSATDGVIAKGKSDKNKKSDLKENMKKAWNVCKWLIASGFLAYAGYKSGRDIFAFCKDFCKFLVENKEIFKEILNGSFTVLKGTGNAVVQIAKFIAKHPEATKNTMAAVGTYHVGKGLYDKVKKWFSNDKSDSQKETTYKIEAKISKK